jgi:hypothetical protein
MIKDCRRGLTVPLDFKTVIFYPTMTNKLIFGEKVKIPILNVCGMYIGRGSRGHRIRYGLMDIIITSPPKKAHVRKERRLSDILDSNDEYLNPEGRGLET